MVCLYTPPELGIVIEVWVILSTVNVGIKSTVETCVTLHSPICLNPSIPNVVGEISQEIAASGADSGVQRGSQMNSNGLADVDCDQLTLSAISVAVCHGDPSGTTTKLRPFTDVVVAARDVPRLAM